jgi:hypothetical protein
VQGSTRTDWNVGIKNGLVDTNDTTPLALEQGLNNHHCSQPEKKNCETAEQSGNKDWHHANRASC